MKKWPVTLSTTDSSNYIGIVKVRQGNLNTEVLEATIIENGLPLDLTGCKATFQVKIGQAAVEQPCTIINPKKGQVEYVFDSYTMQTPGRFFANIAFKKGEELIGTTQDFSYFVIQAVSKTEVETGSYWQSIEDLLEDMKEFINAGQGDFIQWFESVQDILADIDPGGKLLREIMDARKDLSGEIHKTVSDRLNTDFLFIEKRLRDAHYTIPSGDVSTMIVLQDDSFFNAHETEIVGKVDTIPKNGALVIAAIETGGTGIFYFEKVGMIDG